MILAIDVHYARNTACVAGVLFERWDAENSVDEYVSTVNGVEDYEPGRFYKRELPCLLRLLSDYHLTPSSIVIDGYVFLDGTHRPGLGKYLFDALCDHDSELDNAVEVIGVAKTAFSGISREYELCRGTSQKPLCITSTGELDIAKRNIAHMHGEHRIPVLLKRVDRLCRDAANSSK